MKHQTPNKITEYLDRSNLAYEQLSEDMWVVHDEEEDVDNLVITYVEPLVIFRVKLMSIPEKNKESFYEKLLYLNTHSLVHGAYGIEGQHIVIVDTLEAENLDFNEFLASLEAITLAIRSDYPELSPYINQR